MIIREGDSVYFIIENGNLEFQLLEGEITEDITDEFGKTKFIIECYKDKHMYYIEPIYVFNNLTLALEKIKTMYMSLGEILKKYEEK